MRPERGVRIGSMFSGYGGLEMGVSTALGVGTELAFVADVDPDANKVLTRRYPDVPNLGDITQVDWNTVGHVDILCGGSPCQDLSVAGRRAGMYSDTRSGLWGSMVNAIGVMRPSWVVWENVRGAFSARAFSRVESDEGRVGTCLSAIGRVIGDLSEVGYDARWETVRASDVGAPHRRERVFVLAHPRGKVTSFPLKRQTRLTEKPSKLLPTPVARDGKDSTIGVRVSRSKDFSTLSRAGVHYLQGMYDVAERRWEIVTGRVAPPFSNLNTLGKPQVSAEYPEWMMGLPRGWVTDVVKTRRRAMKVIGNGVVPLQAALAVSELMGAEQDEA